MSQYFDHWQNGNQFERSANFHQLLPFTTASVLRDCGIQHESSTNFYQLLPFTTEPVLRESEFLLQEEVNVLDVSSMVIDKTISPENSIIIPSTQIETIMPNEIANKSKEYSKSDTIFLNQINNVTKESLALRKSRNNKSTPVKKVNILIGDKIKLAKAKCSRRGTLIKKV